MDDVVRRCADDGLHLPEIKRHSLEKIALHNTYARIFTTAMRRKWPQLAYVGLYAGAGRARVVPTGEIVETSALAVLQQPTPFTKYVFVESDPEGVQALRARVATLGTTADVTIVSADANASVAQIRAALPRYSASKGLLSFCFVDPFDLQLQFATLRGLADLKMDFLVLLMLGVDARRNWMKYLLDERSARVGAFIDSPNWRAEYRKSGESAIRFVARRFDSAMQQLGYLSAADDLHPIKVTGKNVLLYLLAFYSKDKLGQRFWRESVRGASAQLGLGF